MLGSSTYFVTYSIIYVNLLSFPLSYLAAHSAVQLPPAAVATLDLHYLSATGAAVMLRAWLLLLKRSAMAGRRVPPGTTFGIVTGRYAACRPPGSMCARTGAKLQLSQQCKPSNAVCLQYVLRPAIFSA